MESCKKCIRVSSWDQSPRKERKGESLAREQYGLYSEAVMMALHNVRNCGRRAGLSCLWVDQPVDVGCSR